MRLFLTSLLLLVSVNAAAACPSLLDRSVQTVDEQSRSLCEYGGKVLLVVNTASHCGYTPQYEGLEALYRRYRDRGLVVLGFPANDFGAQEPGSNGEIAKFCEVNFGVSFPMFAKSGVSEGNANPLFASLAAKTGERPHWNFHKYLIDRNGEKVLSFDSGVAPENLKLVGAIESLLASPAPRP
jgi:glutathione peroxidase